MASCNHELLMQKDIKLGNFMTFPYKLIDLTHVLDSNIPTWNGGCGFIYHDEHMGYSDAQWTQVFFRFLLGQAPRFYELGPIPERMIVQTYNLNRIPGFNEALRGKTYPGKEYRALIRGRLSTAARAADPDYDADDSDTDEDY